MRNPLPPPAAATVRGRVAKLADEASYLHMDKVRASQFLDRLVADAQIKEILKGYLQPTRVRTYIKDGPLSHYSNVKQTKARPSDYKPIIKDVLRITATEISRKESVWIFKQQPAHQIKCFVLVADGHYDKWQTALRHALLKWATLPVARKKEADIRILLSLYAGYKVITAADKKLLDRALTRCGARAYIYGEGK